MCGCEPFDELTVTFVRKIGAKVILRGLRTLVGHGV